MGAVIRLLLLQYGPQVTSPAVTDEPRPMATVVEEFHGRDEPKLFLCCYKYLQTVFPPKVKI